MAHENLARDQHVEGSSNRAFGLVFAAVFVIIGIWPVFFAAPPRWWSIALGAAFAVPALLAPATLQSPNRLWTKFGILLGRAVSPIALGVLFYAVITPISVLMRATGKDSLRLSRDSQAESYWIARNPPGPPPDSMTNQF